MNKLLEDKRNQLMSQGRRGEKEKGTGKSRYEMRVNSKVASTVKEFNDIDMQSLFVHNILTVNIPVIGETDNYTVRIKYGGFLDLLRKQIDRQGGVLDLRAITRALLDGYNQEDVYIHCSCLHPDTRIKLADGTSPTVRELLDRFNSGEKLACYAIDLYEIILEDEVTSVRITGKSKEFTKITLDDGNTLMTTPEHLYRLSNGLYAAADTLCVGESLTADHTVKAVENIVLGSEIEVYDISVRRYHNFLTDVGVILHNCPDYKYRFAYWSTMKDINSGAPEKRPAKITNPQNNKGPGCKHIMLVLSNNSWLIKVARVINNWIIYMSKYRKKQYADVVYPAIYGKAYEEPVQLSMDDEQDLNDQSSIERANELGRTRGQFKAGNRYRFTPRNNAPGQVSIDDTETETEVEEES